MTKTRFKKRVRGKKIFKMKLKVKNTLQKFKKWPNPIYFSKTGQM